MVKIKDFTLASQNLEGHVPPPPVRYTPGAHGGTGRSASSAIG